VNKTASVCLLIIPLSLVACAKSGTVLNPTAETSTANVVILPETTVPTGTLMPTLAPEESEDLVEENIKNNGGCELPCIWGLVPGETTTEAANLLFVNLGWEPFTEFNKYETGGDLHSGGDQYEGGVRFSLYPKSGTLRKANIAIFLKNFTESIGYFSIKNIMTQLGQPAEVLMFVGIGELQPSETLFEIFVYYDDLNLIARFSGTAQKQDAGYEFCPSHPNFYSTQEEIDSGFMAIYIGSETDDSIEDILQPFWSLVYPFLPSEEAVGVTPNDFYRAILDESEPACFRTIAPFSYGPHTP
jgi:hypothetical protein